jgi:hypothetical protein
MVQPGNLSVWTLKALHLHKLSRLLRDMEEADAVDERFYNALLCELSGIFIEPQVPYRAFAP